MAASDVDLVLVLVLVLPEHTPDAVREALVDELTDLVETRSRNPAQVLPLTRDQLRDTLAHEDPLIESLRQDARTLAGPSLTSLLADPVAAT